MFSIVPRLRLASLNKGNVGMEVKIPDVENGGMDPVFSSINIFTG
jgi:hypothetical protein